MLPTVKKPPTYGRRLSFKRVEEVRLHTVTLTRFDRDGYGKIANCSQMLHIEIGYSQITSYLSTTNYELLIVNNTNWRSQRESNSRIPRDKRTLWPLDHGTRLVQAVGIEPTGSAEPRFYGPVPYFHGVACKMAEETGVEPACARISDTDWFSGSASHRGTPLPFWRRVRDLNSRHLAVLLVSSEVV